MANTTIAAAYFTLGLMGFYWIPYQADISELGEKLVSVLELRIVANIPVVTCSHRNVGFCR